MNNRIQPTPEQVDSIWIELIEYLLNNELFDFAEKVMQNLNDKDSSKVKYFRAQILHMKGETDKAIEVLDEMLGKRIYSKIYYIGIIFFFWACLLFYCF